MKLTASNIHTLLIALASSLVAGCTDDFDITQTSTDQMRFSASIERVTSRSSNHDGLTPAVDIIPMATGSGSDSLYLHAEVLDTWDLNADGQTISRSNMVSSSSGMYDNINLSAYYYTDAWSADKADYQPNYFYFESASGNLASGYDLDLQRYWPKSGRMRFLAYAPFDATNDGSYRMANVDGDRGPYIYINIDTDISKHRDLLVSYTEHVECTGSNAPVHLNFKHALSCIQFVMADDMPVSRVKKITINNVKYQGEMRFHDNMAAEDASSSSDASINNCFYAWDGTRNYTLDFVDAANPNGLEVNAGELITDEAHSFMMFPQIVPDGAEIQITLSRQQADGSWGPDEYMFGYISAKHWPAGKILRYAVSNERWWQELQVSSLPAFPPQGGDQNFNITSFDIDNSGTKKGIRWTAKYEDPANPGTFIETQPSWYSFETENQGAINPQSIKVTVQPLDIDHYIDLDAQLRNATPAGSKENPINLSTGTAGTTSVGTTANCYIVDRPGWYIIPLVYGNAIAGGNPNVTAYNPNADSSNGALKNFVNYQGNDITSPYILTDCSADKAQITAGSAGIVWQDEPNLIRSTSISVDKSAFGGNGGIIFEVSSADIIQGNCVIGLHAPGSTDTMMWSWHIWVTPFFRPGLDPLITETIGVTNYDGITRQILYLNLGWCSSSPLEIYKGRSSKVQFTATTDDGRTLTSELTVVQTPFVRYWHGRNTYYQWGRKDPFQPFLKSYEQTWYDGSGTQRYENPSAQKWGGGTKALKERICNPLLFHTSDEEWGLLDNGNWDYKPVNITLYTNLWDATYSAVPVVNKYDKDAIEPIKVPERNNVKTVYDPCPAGYKVPPVDSFTGFTNTGNDIGSLVDNPKNWNGMLMSYNAECGGKPAINDPYIYLFYTNTDKTSYIAFPLSGYRDWRWSDEYKTAGASYQMGNYGYSWTAGAASTIQGYYLELCKDPDSFTTDNAWIMPLDYYWQLDALTIRPCHE